MFSRIWRIFAPLNTQCLQNLRKMGNELSFQVPCAMCVKLKKSIISKLTDSSQKHVIQQQSYGHYDQD